MTQLLEDICYSNQMEYCKKNKLPLFAYQRCPSCQSTLEQGLMKTRTKEDAQLYSASNLITGCPICRMTWCD